MIDQRIELPATRPLPTPTAAWSYDYPAYFSDGDLRASVFGRDLVVLAKEFEGGAIVGLDAATGAVRFETAGLAALRDGDGPLYVLGVATGTTGWGGDVTVSELAPADGAVVRTVKLTPTVPTFPTARFALAGTALVVITDGEVAAYDLVTGAQRWRTKARSSYLFAPVVQADRVIVVNETYTALRLTDGATLWTFAGACCGAVASPDGRHLFVRVDEQATVELDRAGQVVRRLAGQVTAATDAWVAVQGADALAALPHDRDLPLWRKAGARGDAFTAVGAAGPWLTYFDLRDHTLWLHDLVGDARVALRVAHERVVISPDASGTAPAFIGAPAIWAPPRAFVFDWELHAYEVGDGQ